MSQTQSRVERNRAVAEVISLLDEGYRSTIVALQTGVAITMVRACYTELYASKVPAASGSLPDASIILANNNRSGNILEASILMAIYTRMGGEAVKTSINMDILTRSYRIYLAVRQTYDQRGDNRLLDINRAWVLARDYRCRLVSIEKCNCCGTHYAYFVHNEKKCGFCVTSKPRAADAHIHLGSEMSALLPMFAQYDDQMGEASRQLANQWAQ
tara:strand:+ start:198 stop:839 length:642 start_codon:yes stop_codon:yes gene_type:complete